MTRASTSDSPDERAAARAPSRLLGSMTGLFAQLFFIAAGVYLGMQADAYKEERAHRAAARATLENFRTEMTANRDAVKAVMGYHAGLLDSMTASQRRGDAPPRTTREVRYVPPKLAFAIGRLYSAQTRIEQLQTSATAELFSPLIAEENWETFVRTLAVHLEEMRVTEPNMVRSYDVVIARIDSVLASSP